MLIWAGMRSWLTATNTGNTSEGLSVLPLITHTHNVTNSTTGVNNTVVALKPLNMYR